MKSTAQRVQRVSMSDDISRGELEEEETEEETEEAREAREEREGREEESSAADFERRLRCLPRSDCTLLLLKRRAGATSTDTHHMCIGGCHCTKWNGD